MDFGLFIVEPDYEAMKREAFNKHYGEQTRWVKVNNTQKLSLGFCVKFFLTKICE